MTRPLFVLLLSLAGLARGGNWPHWRGPFFDGSSTETNLPAQWTKTDNVAWSAPLPGFSGATPVIWDDAVFVSSPDAQKNLLLFCFDRKTGRVRWQKEIATGDRQTGRNNAASPSPVTDGRAVFVLFATGDLAALDYSGRELWRRNLAAEYGRFANMWQYGSSPTLFAGKLYVQVLQQSPVPAEYSHAQDGNPNRDSALLCLDPVTGKNLWHQVRPTDAAGESQEAYTTPIPHQGRTGSELLVMGGNYLTAHDEATGRELWRCGGLNVRGESHWRTVPSPVAAGDMIIACAPRGDPVLGIKDGGQGLVTDSRIAWRFREFPSDCVTPLCYSGKLFVLDGDKQMITCLDPLTGLKQWQGNLGVHEIFRASPTGADGKIYCLGESGTAVVLSSGDEFKILSTIPMSEAPVRSSIAAAHGQLFIRTAKALYCIARL